MSRTPGYERLPYEKHRKHRLWSEDHPPTAAQRRVLRRTKLAQRANMKDASFGKINWNAWAHTTLYDMIMTADPVEMGASAHQWGKLAYDVDSATSAVHKTVQKLLLSWRGGAAGSAAQSASKLTSWGTGASETMRTVGDKLDHYTSAVETAKHKMPEPVFYTAENQFRDGYDLNAASGPSGAVMVDQLLDDHLPAKRAASHAKAEAVRVMESYETSSKGVHDKLPHFTDAPAVTNVDPDGRSRSEARGSRDSSGSSDAAVTTASSAPAGGAGLLPGASGPGGTAGMPGSLGGGALGALGSGTGAGSGSALPGGLLGGSVGAGGGAAAGAAGAAAGMRGGSPMSGGFFPPMAGQRGDGSDDHQNRYTKGSSFDFLEDLPDAYPPVLGE
ncbi:MULTISPECIES: PPE domain-containing protein [Amycolatopsis]|uniref:PPE domain-containing protein n=1 Tax=Amycolatopsis dendrobii TaxID=2760662 RepID=A0A7W3ZFQ8_9PSEU|nr:MULTISPECIES: PPE domain-containing protein [Amycolatopsis]MBB1159342.1 PPE domain-containing protein [Amycolatopsis dendrobii]UKD56004.1 PPE domain-containing protein [Amycolatopsis sp. FU40]